MGHWVMCPTNLNSQFSESKPAMDKEKKRYETEWSFSFENVGDSVNKFFKSINIGGEVELKTSEFVELVDNATTARVSLGLSIGETVVKDGSGIDNLIDAEIVHVGEVEFEVSGTTEKSVRLAQKRFGGIDDAAAQVGSFIGGKRQELHWNVGLTNLIPLQLEIEGGVGPVDLQLTELKLTGLQVKGGVGEIRAELPVTESAYEVSINGGVGRFILEIPEGAALTLNLNGGVGNFEIYLPQTAAVRIESVGGLGLVDLPDHFIQLSEEGSFIDKSGTWQTEGYDLASRQITIHYKGGVGNLKVR